MVVKRTFVSLLFFGHSLYTFSSPLISTLICNRMAPETLDLSERFSKLYQTSISPDKVLTSIMVWPRKSSDSLVNFCLNLDFKSLSSSQTRTLMRSDELWHSLQKKLYHILLSKSHGKRFCRSLNSLCMGFTFLMDANTSQYFYNYFIGTKQTLINHWKIKINLWNWEISFTFSWYLKISLFTFTS